MREIRLLVFGGRRYRDGARVNEHIFNICSGVDLSNVTIIHGDANRQQRMGADYFAHAFCERWHGSGLKEKPYPAKWDDLDAPGAVIRTRRDGTKYNVLAGFHRNQRMLDEGKPTHALEMPGGTGTADMHRRIEKANARGARINLTVVTDGTSAAE